MLRIKPLYSIVDRYSYPLHAHLPFNVELETFLRLRTSIDLPYSFKGISFAIPSDKPVRGVCRNTLFLLEYPLKDSSAVYQTFKIMLTTEPTIHPTR